MARPFRRAIRRNVCPISELQRVPVLAVGPYRDRPGLGSRRSDLGRPSWPLGAFRVIAMRFGFTLPNNWGLEDPQDVVDLGVAAEEAGFDSVWVNHHVLNVGYVADRLGHRPYYDALTILTWAAARTTRVKLGTSVLVVPYLHPMTLAKALATLDHLSRGRLIVGVGAGSLPEENAALGVPYDTRGAYTDESLAVLKELWTAPEPAFHGTFFDFSDVLAAPKPRQSPHPPIVIGGNRRPALRRVARYGDGWHPMSLPPESVAARLIVLGEELALVGRSLSEISVSIRLDVVVLEDGAALRPGGSPLTGSVAHIRQQVERYRDVGVQEIILSISSSDLARQHSMLDRLAAEVLPAAQCR